MVIENCPRLLTRQQAAEFLTANGFPTSKATLAKRACLGGGPTYQDYNGKSMYSPENLLKWAESRLSAPRQSTSDAAA